MGTFVKLTAPVAIGGAIAQAGELVEVLPTEAKLLIHLGKAVTVRKAPATGADDGDGGRARRAKRGE